MTLLRASLLGGVDGVITSFAIVAGADAGELGLAAVLVVGSSSLLADGLSMGVSEYLSAAAERAASGAASGAGGGAGAARPRGGRARRASRVLRLVACGAVPLAVYAISTGLLAAAAFALVALMLLGAGRARATGEPLLLGLSQTALLGAAAGGVAFGVGRAGHAALG